MIFLADFFKNLWIDKTYAAQKMKFSIKDFFSKCDQMRRNLPIWSHLQKKSIMEYFIFCAVLHLKKFNPLMLDILKWTHTL